MLRLAFKTTVNKEQGYKIQHDPGGDICYLYADTQPHKLSNKIKYVANSLLFACGGIC